MRTIETTATIAADGTLTAKLPPDVAPGDHSVIIVIDNAEVRRTAVKAKPPFPVIDIGPWPDDLSLRREDMYGDDGR